ncbi:MAG: hypothetical protein K2Q01_11845 [Rickettsiales bacterium]|nr:hypothetical protein [Rickettsiales bacterium]
MAGFDYGIVVPVRAGSVRIVQKNMLPFGGISSLLEWKIRQMREVFAPERIYVSSEDAGYLAIAQACGVQAHVRDPRLAGGTEVAFHEVITGIVTDIPHAHIAWCPVTCPLMTPAEYQACFASYDAQVLKGAYDSLVGVNVLKEYLWNDAGPLNYAADHRHPPSQELANIYRVTNGIYMYAKDAILKRRYFLGERPYKQVLSKLAGIDIDEMEDYKVAQALYPLYAE